MNLDAMFGDPNEKPFDTFPADGGFCGIFRTVACIGDSLSAGQFVTQTPEGHFRYRDNHDYSWGQYLGRMAGCKVHTFAGGGMTAKYFCENFGDELDIWNPEKRAQAYIIALGVNDIINDHGDVGSTADIDLSDWRNNTKNFAGYVGQIIQRYKEIEPRARFFLMTIPHDRGDDKDALQYGDAHAKLMYSLAEFFPYTYVMDFRKYAPRYDEEFQEKFFLFDHLNPMGYLLTGRMVVSYLDYIIRHNMKDFIQAGFIGTEFYMDRFDQKEAAYES